MKKACFLFICILFSMLCISGCGEPAITSPLTDQWEQYDGVFEKNDVAAELIFQDDMEYLQLTFPDGAVVTYRYGLEQITQDLIRIENGITISAELNMKIKNGKTALVYLFYEDGITNVEFVLPDFSEMLPDKVFAKQTNAEAFAIIEEWISEEEMAAFYQQAKDMEQRMREYQAAE